MADKRLNTFLRQLLNAAMQETDAKCYNVFNQSNGVKAWGIQSTKSAELRNLLEPTCASLGYTVTISTGYGSHVISLYIRASHLPQPRENVAPAEMRPWPLPKQPAPRICKCCGRPL